MALYMALNSDSTSVISDSNPIQTKHSSEGEPVSVSVYIYNDGKRKNVANDSNPPPLLYSNLRINVVGVSYVLQQLITSSISDINLYFDSVSGWNIGTIIIAGMERIRIEEVLSNTSVRVTRNYTADGKTSIMSSHSVGEVMVAETLNVSLALPDPSDISYSTAGTYIPNGGSLQNGLDPSLLTTSLDAQDTSTIVASNNGLLYKVNSLIKIDNETMKVVAVAGNNIQVIRGYSSTRANHTVSAIIYCVGLVDLAPITHKVFIKNDPPSGLPTQKKKDIQIVLVADEEPV